MKKHLFLVFLFSCGFSFAQAWESSFNLAQTKAAETNKKVLLVFSGSDWCIPCIRLEDKVWKSDKFQAFAKEKLYMYRADFPKRKKNQLPAAKKEENEQLASQYNSKGYFPWVVVFSSKGEVLGVFAYEDKAVAEYIKTIDAL